MNKIVIGMSISWAVNLCLFVCFAWAKEYAEAFDKWYVGFFNIMFNTSGIAIVLIAIMIIIYLSLRYLNKGE